MEEKVIPANLHFTEPNPDIPALRDGRMKVVSTNTPWNGGYAGVSSFGFGGANVHVLLKSNEQEKPHRKKHQDKPQESKEPRLFTFSARTKEVTYLHY